MQQLIPNLPLQFINSDPNDSSQRRWDSAGPTPAPPAATNQQPTPVSAASIPTSALGGQQAQGGLLPHQSVLDHVIFALTGTPTSMRTPAEQHQQALTRKQAADESVQASVSPGDQYMWAPGTGSAGGGPGGGFGLSDLVRLFHAVAPLIGGG